MRFFRQGDGNDPFGIPFWVSWVQVLCFASDNDIEPLRQSDIRPFWYDLGNT